MKRFAWTLMLVGVIIIQSLVVPRWFPYSWAPHLLLDIALAVTILNGRSRRDDRKLFWITCGILCRSELCLRVYTFDYL